MERPLQKRPFPQRDGSVRECGAANPPGETPGQAGQFVLQVLCLLAIRSARGIGPNGFDRIADAADFLVEPGHDHGKVGREDTIVVDQEDVLNVFDRVATDEYGNDL